MATKIRWAWSSGGAIGLKSILVEYKALATALRARRGQGLTPLFMITRRKAFTVASPVSVSSVQRVLRNFVVGQCEALAIDLGDDSRQGMLLAGRVCAHTAEGRSILNSKHRVNVRRARSVALATLVSLQGDALAKTLLVLKLRSRRKGETPPAKVLEAFMKTEALA